MSVCIRQADETALEDWASLRHLLWPRLSKEEHKTDLQSFFAMPDKKAGFLAYSEDGKAIAFAEVSVRFDYVNGCETSPVGFLEGVFVLEANRRNGAARSLIERVASWSESRGLRELASDANVANLVSHAMHKSFGFVETQRVVYFRRKLTEYPSSSQDRG